MARAARVGLAVRVGVGASKTVASSLHEALKVSWQVAGDVASMPLCPHSKTTSHARSIVKVPGKENLADMLTKHVGREALDATLMKMGYERREGRHPLNPVL